MTKLSVNEVIANLMNEEKIFHKNTSISSISSGVEFFTVKDNEVLQPVLYLNYNFPDIDITTYFDFYFINYNTHNPINMRNIKHIFNYNNIPLKEIIYTI